MQLQFCALAAALLALPAVQAQGVRQDVRVELVRFWRTDGATLVEAVVGLPVRPDVARGNPAVELAVRDSTGRVLYETSWTDTISDAVIRVAREHGGTEITKRFSVALRPGAYAVWVRMRDAQDTDSALVNIHSFSAPPIISDLLVGSAMRTLAAGQEATAAETRRGQYAIERGARVRLLPTSATLSYYLELYAGAGAQPVPVTLQFAVERPAGGPPVSTVSRSFAVAPPGAVDAAKLDLTGLPPGDYRLVVTARAGTREERREAAFTVLGFADRPAIAQPAAPRVTTEAAIFEQYFTPALRDSLAIRNLVEALTLAPPRDAVPTAHLQMTADAQRRFLASYWARHDPTPGTPENELLAEYTGRVEFVQREYAERDLRRSGVHTDRGRIYLKYGAPDDKLIIPMTQNRAVEIWKYSRQRFLKFAFLDETGFQHYNLILTTDPLEQTLLDWQTRVGDAQVVRTIINY
jgi:GWxTD domain-containing protein